MIFLEDLWEHQSIDTNLNIVMKHQNIHFKEGDEINSVIENNPQKGEKEHSIAIL